MVAAQLARHAVNEVRRAGGVQQRVHSPGHRARHLLTETLMSHDRVHVVALVAPPVSRSLGDRARTLDICLMSASVVLPRSLGTMVMRAPKASNGVRALASIEWRSRRYPRGRARPIGRIATLGISPANPTQRETQAESRGPARGAPFQGNGSHFTRGHRKPKPRSESLVIW